MMTESKLRQSLIAQLEEKNIKTDYNLALVDDYVKLWKINKELHKDVKERGAKIKTYNSKGCEVTKTNESLTDIQKNESTMLKIYQSMKLQDPVMKGTTDDYL